MVRSLTGYLINRNNVLSNTLNRRFALEWSFQSSVEDPFHGSGSHLPLFDWLYVAVSINESHFKRSGTYTCRMSVGWQSSKCPGGEKCCDVRLLASMPEESSAIHIYLEHKQKNMLICNFILAVIRSIRLLKLLKLYDSQPEFSIVKIMKIIDPQTVDRCKC